MLAMQNEEGDGEGRGVWGLVEEVQLVRPRRKVMDGNDRIEDRPSRPRRDHPLRWCDWRPVNGNADPLREKGRRRQMIGSLYIYACSRKVPLIEENFQVPFLHSHFAQRRAV